MKFLTLLKPKQAFTIIELLVVVGIISILAIALLVTLNPTEAQKKSRDAKRVKDATTIQAIIETYLGDGGDTICDTVCNSLTSGSANTANSQTCGSTNWLSTDMCEYAQSVPSDPINNTGRSCAEGGETVEETNCALVYFFEMEGSNYEIAVPQESVDNADKLINDPGENPFFIEIESSTTAINTSTTATFGVTFP